MGLFGNPNDKLKKAMEKGVRNGTLNPNAYKTRPHCGACKYYAAGLNYCNLQKGKRSAADLCNSFWAK